MYKNIQYKFNKRPIGNIILSMLIHRDILDNIEYKFKIIYVMKTKYMPTYLENIFIYTN